MLYDVDQGFAVKNEFFVVRAESGKNATNTAGTTGTAAGIAAATGVVGRACVSSYDDLDDDDSIALDMEEAIDDDIMFHGGNPFDWDTRSDYLDDPFGFGGDDGDGGEDW